MGNSETSTSRNSTLGNTLISKLTLKESAAILGVFPLFPQPISPNPLHHLLNLLICTSKRVSMFCLITGDSRPPHYSVPNASIVQVLYSQKSLYGNILVLTDSSGVLRVIDPYTLKLLFTISNGKQLPLLYQRTEQAVCMSMFGEYIVVTGHLDGTVQCWDLKGKVKGNSWKMSEQLPSVRCLACSSALNTVYIGFESSYKGPDNNLVRLDLNPIFVVNMELYETQQLEFNHTCYSIEVIEPKGLLLALNSSSQLYVWDLAAEHTLTVLLTPAMATNIIPLQTVSVFIHPKLYLILKLSDNSLVITQLLNPPVLLPIKRIKPFKHEIHYLCYDVGLDALLIGTTHSSVLVISDFTSEISKEVLSCERFYESMMAALREQYPLTPDEHISLLCESIWEELKCDH